MPEPILYKNEVFQIIGACMAVHSDKGNGFVEPVYQDCMEIELAHLDIPFKPQANFPIFHRGIQLKHSYTPRPPLLRTHHRRTQSHQNPRRRTSRPSPQLPQSDRPTIGAIGEFWFLWPTGMGTHHQNRTAMINRKFHAASPSKLLRTFAYLRALRS
jgi:hypothetical protein